MTLVNGNARAIQGELIANLPSSIAAGNFGVLLYSPDLDVMTWQPASILDASRVLVLNNRWTNDGRNQTSVANSGVVTYGSNGLKLSSDGQNNGIARCHFPYEDNSNFSFYEQLQYCNFHAKMTHAAGDGKISFGLIDQLTNITEDSTSKGIWITVDITGGTVTVYAVTADGTSRTKTDITSGISLGNPDNINMTIINNTTANTVTFYRGSNLLATHTTNIPSGQGSNDYEFVAEVLNDVADTETRDLTLDVTNTVLKKT